MTPVKQRQFQIGSVVEFYRKSDFLLCENELIDFLPTVWESEVDILEKWMEHFKIIGIPYAVTREKKCYKNGYPLIKFTLWKQIRA